MNTKSANYTLGRTERLKSRKLIDALFKEKAGFNVFPFRVLYKLVENAEFPLQAGFGVSSRNFRKSVERNRIKRLTREAYRLQKKELAEQLNTYRTQQKRGLALFFIYTGKELPDYKTAIQRMKQIFEKLIVVINEDISANT